MAFSSSLSHLFVDFHIGLFGPSSLSMSLPQASLAAAFGVLYGWWAFSLGAARHGSSSGLVAAFAFAIGWAFCVNGLIAMLVAPPPSAGFPYQDITHVGSLIFGGAAAYGLWQKVHELPEVGWRAACWPALPILIATSLEGMLAL